MILTPQLPAAGSIKVFLKGSVVVLAGKEEKVLEVKDAVLDGLELKIGVLKESKSSGIFKDIVPGKGKAKDVKRMTFRGSQPIKLIELLDAAGKEITAARPSSSHLGAKPEFTLNLRVPDKLNRCTVRVTYFEMLERVVVPFDLEIGVGF